MSAEKSLSMSDLSWQSGRMLLEKVFERFAEKTPVSVMTRATMEYALCPKDVDALFEQKAEQQYTRQLLFSSVVDLMGTVVAKIEPSVHAAYQAVEETLPVTITAVYDKINKIEPRVTAALVSHTAERLAEVVSETGGRLEPLLPGHRVRIIDGNHFPATERRLEVLRRCQAGPLPGHALVVLDPSLMLATHMIPCEDGHAQERSLSSEIIELVEPNDVWLADRNFCTTALLGGIADRGGYFVIRRHAHLPVRHTGDLVPAGEGDTGELVEVQAEVSVADRVLPLREVILKLKKPTRDGERQLSIVTNLPQEVADAQCIASLYRERWTLETMFQSLTTMLASELNTLGYPRAALLGFGISLVSYNILSVVQAALRAQHGAEKIGDEVSGFYIANEVRKYHEGMGVAVPDELWEQYQAMSAKELAGVLVSLAAKVNLRKLKKHPRGPKKPVPKRDRHTKKPHVSTARLLWWKN